MGIPFPFAPFSCASRAPSLSLSPPMNTQDSEPLTTVRKALTINFDTSKYGTFAEIGAGQEVARQFFQVGGAAGTIAKSMSAYDMTFSNEIYGKSRRYGLEGETPLYSRSRVCAPQGSALGFAG